MTVRRLFVIRCFKFDIWFIAGVIKLEPTSFLYQKFMVRIDFFLRVMDVFFIFFGFNDSCKYKVLRIAKLVIKQFVITRRVCHLLAGRSCSSKGSRPEIVSAPSCRSGVIAAVAAQGVLFSLNWKMEQDIHALPTQLLSWGKSRPWMANKQCGFFGTGGVLFRTVTIFMGWCLISVLCYVLLHKHE